MRVYCALSKELMISPDIAHVLVNQCVSINLKMLMTLLQQKIQVYNLSFFLSIFVLMLSNLRLNPYNNITSIFN